MPGKIDKPTLPLPKPLSGADFGSFAYLTVTDRMPRIARETLERNEFAPEAAENLEDLIQDIPSAPIRALRDDAAPDAGDWREYVKPYLGKHWREVPWFFAEIYFYRRILEAIGYYLPGPHQGYDPYQDQKATILQEAEPSINTLAAELEEALNTNVTGGEKYRRDLQNLMVQNVWGNQADLSMWSTDEERPNHQDVQTQRSHLLVDDADAVLDHLFQLPTGQIRVDFILDNYGPELAHDLALADYLLTTRLAGRILLHAKPYPYFVSDATIEDIYTMLDWFEARAESSVRALGSRIHSHLNSRNLQIEEDFFWTSPLPFWEMPDRIRTTLKGSDLVISKGDANYRRLAGDLSWPPTMPFAGVVGYFPAPLLALRVLKAELALGLSSEQVERLNSEGLEWLVDGNWGVIQFWK